MNQKFLLLNDFSDLENQKLKKLKLRVNKNRLQIMSY